MAGREHPETAPAPASAPGIGTGGQAFGTRVDASRSPEAAPTGLPVGLVAQRLSGSAARQPRGSGQTNSELTESLLWMRRIASAKSGAIDKN